MILYLLAINFDTLISGLKPMATDTGESERIYIFLI